MSITTSPDTFKVSLKEKNKLYYYNNKELITKRHKLYRNKNKEFINEYNKIYNNNNKELLKDYRKNYYDNNKKLIKYYCNINRELINIKQKDCYYRKKSLVYLINFVIKHKEAICKIRTEFYNNNKTGF